MKNLVPWLKSNLLIVIAVALAVIAAPVLMYFSGGWGAKIRQGVQQKVSKQLQDLDAIDVTYTVPAYLKGQKAVEVRGTPNEASTAAVKELLESAVRDIAEVRERALAFNSRGKGLLIGGSGAGEQLLPAPADESTRIRLSDELRRRWPAAHVELLREVGAGAPPSAEQVAARLEQVQKQEINRITGGRDASALSGEDKVKLAEVLSDRRLEVYRSTAQGLRFYAGAEAFKNVQAWAASDLPLEQVWEWQHLYWVHQDIVKALATANTDASGLMVPVFQGAVKRLVSVTVRKPGESAKSDGGRGGSGGSSGSGDDQGAGGASAGGGGGSENAEIAPVYTLSHTGRAAAPVAPNGVYDLRYVDVVVDVDSAQLPAVLAAFPRTNFMTVVGLSLERHDPLADLAFGFDFGSAHVVRATIQVETVWLRGWMKKWMPASVRKALGIPDDPAPAPAGSAEGEGGGGGGTSGE